MISLLEDYVNVLRGTDSGDATNYYMPVDTVSSEEWASFDNVYQVHCPRIFMNESVRDVCTVFPALYWC